MSPRQKITEALEKPMPLWGVIKLLVMIIIGILGAVWAHGNVTYATKDAVRANQREIKVMRDDVRQFRRDFKDFRAEQKQDLREIKNLLLPEPPR